ncbi:universal stress protein [Pseudomonas sp. Marseille-QA0892]
MGTQSIVVSVDGSETQPSVCAYAAWLCRALEAPVSLVHAQGPSAGQVRVDRCGVIRFDAHHTVLNDLITRGAPGRGRLPSAVRIMLEKARQFFSQVGVDCMGLHTYRGTWSEALRRSGPTARLFVVGRRDAQQSGARYVGGSLEALVESVDRPVLLSPSAFRTPGSAMVAYDGSANAERILDFMTSNPLFRSLDVHLVMVGPRTGAAVGALTHAAARLAEANIAARVELCQGRVEPTLHAYRAVNGIDLMLMGAFGYSSLKRFLLGSTTAEILNAPCSKPVLVFP